MKLCKVEGCGRIHSGLGYCDAHYQRVKLTGNANPEKPIGCKSGKWNSRWKGGQIKFDGGRILIYSPGHPYPNVDGIYVFRYRLVMEKHLGRFLLPNELIHHKNSDVTDDRIENLEILNHSEHAIKHRNPKTNKFQSKEYNETNATNQSTHD